MKKFGIVIIVIGILMLVFTQINFKRKVNVVDLGDVEINRNKTEHVTWPIYAGGFVILAGIGMLAFNTKK